MYAAFKRRNVQTWTPSGSDNEPNCWQWESYSKKLCLTCEWYKYPHGFKPTITNTECRCAGWIFFYTGQPLITYVYQCWIGFRADKVDVYRTASRVCTCKYIHILQQNSTPEYLAIIFEVAIIDIALPCRATWFRIAKI